MSEGVLFIDIDYRELMLKKRWVVENTSSLSSWLSNIKTSDEDVLLQSDQYYQLGCDLRDLGRLGSVLESLLDINNSRILFTAEVSITYMDVGPADDLIQWAAKFPDGKLLHLYRIFKCGF